MTFCSMGLAPSLVDSLTAQNYTTPYPIQEQTIPAILEGRDVLGIAKTGSGKTASYVLPILTNLQKNQQKKHRHVRALILVPTRELAVQVSDVCSAFARNLENKTKILGVFGGVAINPQMKALQNVDVLIATPGRLLELMALNSVKLSEVETLVLDEADKMLNIGFADEVNQVLKQLPQKCQNLLFSATLNDDIDSLNCIFLDNPLVVKIEAPEENIDSIQQSAYFLTDELKGPLLRYLIKSKEMSQVLIFTSSVARADKVAHKLKNNGIKAQAIHSKKRQGVRTDLLRRFKDGSLQVLVATDLLGRGIDIHSLPFVINYELPRSPKDFVHRIGRTGRADCSGEALTFVSPAEEHHFKIIQKKMKKRVPKMSLENIVLTGL